MREGGGQRPLLCYDSHDKGAKQGDAAQVHELCVGIFTLQVADAYLVAGRKGCLQALQFLVPLFKLLIPGYRPLRHNHALLHRCWAYSQ